MADRPKIVMYGTESCSFCMAARMLLKKKGIEFDEISVSRDAAARRKMEELSGRTTVPQIFIRGKPVGGFDDLCRLDEDGTLDALLGRVRQTRRDT